jgi:hypothetical protein
MEPMSPRGAIDAIREGVSLAVDDGKRALMSWVQEQPHITPVYRTVICEGLAALDDAAFLAGTTDAAVDRVRAMPVLYPRVTYRCPDGREDDIEWSTKLELSVPLKIILDDTRWYVGPRDEQWVRADGSTGLYDEHGAPVECDSGDGESGESGETGESGESGESSDSGESGESSDELVRPVHPLAFAKGELFAWMRAHGVSLDERVVVGTVTMPGGSTKRYAWTDLEWRTFRARSPPGASHELDEPDSYETVDVTGNRRLPPALRGAHEDAVLAEWATLVADPSVAAQLAIIRHHADSASRGGFTAELARWTHPRAR